MPGERNEERADDDSAVKVPSKWVLKAVGIIVPAVLSSIVAYTSAWQSAHDQSAQVKDKAESGYQFAREAIVELQAANKVTAAELVRLHADVTALARKQRQAAHPHAQLPPAAPVAIVVPPVTAPLPHDLDKALAQQQRPDAGMGARQ